MDHEYVSARLQASVGHVQDAVRQVWKLAVVPSSVDFILSFFLVGTSSRQKNMELATPLQRDMVHR